MAERLNRVIKLTNENLMEDDEMSYHIIESSSGIIKADISSTANLKSTNTFFHALLAYGLAVSSIRSFSDSNMVLFLRKIDWMNYDVGEKI